MIEPPTVTSVRMATALSLPIATWAGDPAVGMRDAYKWIYQAVMGGEHAAPSRSEAEQWLRREWTRLGPTRPGEALVEPLGDSRIVRLHLRPFRDRGGSLELLLDAFLSSAASFRPDREAFVEAWRALGQRLRQSSAAHLTYPVWVQLDDEARRAGYPARHHSDAYTRAREPAYRVLTAERAASLVKTLPTVILH